MTLEAKVLTFTANTGTGTQDLTGTSFTPKGAIVWYSRATNTVDTFEESASVGFGFTDGTVSRCVCTTSEDNQASSDTSTTRRTDGSLIFATNLTGTVTTTDAVATFSSWLSNGMQINWTDAPAAAFKFHVLFLGGSDLTNVFIGSITEPAGTGNQDITVDTGWQPDLLIFLTANTTSNSTAAGGNIMIGAADGSANQWVQGIAMESARTTMDTWQCYSHTKSNALQSLTAGSIISGHSFVSMLSTGFRINNDDATAAVSYFLALKGGVYAVGNGTEPASTGNQTITTSKDTKAVMLFGVDTGTSGTAQGGSVFSIGGGTSSSEMATVVIEDVTGAADSVTTSRYETDSIYLNVTANATATSSTVDDEASLSSVSSTGFVLNWSNIGQARPFRYIAFGSSGGTLFTTSITESSISVSDSNTRMLTGMRALSEASISATDSNTRLLTATRTLSDTVTVSDARARLLIATRTAADTVTVNDSLVRTLLATRTRSETAITVSDSLSRLLTAVRSLAEPSISVSDSLTAVPTVLLSRSITEPSISVSDSIARLLIATRSPSETVAVSDSLARLLTATRLVTESTISVLDSLACTPIRVRSLADTVTVSDSLARMISTFRTLTEATISVSDARARLLTATRLLSEPSISVSDSLTRTLILVRSIAEAAITVSDSLTKLLIATRTRSETVTVSDSLARLLIATRLISEPSISVSETIARQIVPVITLLETVTVSDSLARLLLARRTLVDTITVSDLLNAARLRVRLISEAAITVSDSLARRLLAFRVLGETVFVSEVLAVVGPDYEVALYISDRGYSNPLRARIKFISQMEPYPTFYTYDSFNPDARPFNIVSMSVRLAQGEIGGFSMTIEDSAGIVDKAKIGLGVKVVVEVRKEFATPYFKLITGFVRRIKPLRPATGALLYQIDGYGSQVVFNERIVNFKRAAKRTAVDSTTPLSTDSQMQAYRLFSDLITATDILPLKRPTIQSTGSFELTEVSPEVTDFIAQIAPGLTDAATVANALAEITGAIWGTDANGNPFFRYPTQKHSGILVKDAPVSTDLAASTSVNLAAFDFDDSIDVSEGFANRLYVLNAVDTKSTASSSKSSGSTTLTTRGIAQQWTATDNNVTSAAFILSRVGNPVTTSGSISGKLRADNGGYPTGATLATFEIPISSIDTSKSTIFVNDIQTKDGVINPGSKYWWYLLGTDLRDDSNTVRWHHDNDLSTPDRLSAQLPLVDADPTKPGDQLQWIRSVFGPVYTFSTFSSVRHILTQSDSESIKQYGLIEGIVDLPSFDDDATFQKALAKIIYTSAKPKRTYEYNRLTIPTQRMFFPGEMITLIDSKASLTSEKSVMAEIAEVNYNFDTTSNGIGCKYVDIRLIAFLDRALDDYMDTREC